MASPRQLTNRLNEAIAHHKAGRLDRAEAIYKQLASAAPKAAVVFDLWGQLAERQGRIGEAIQYYHRAFHNDGQSISVAVRLASALIACGRISDAEKALRGTLQKNPSSPDAWNALGFTLKLLGRIDDALACHQRAVSINPKFVEGWVHYGLTYGLMGRNFQALQQFENALAINPENVLARHGRAQALHKLYRIEEAIADYDAVLKAQPHHHEARSFRLFALQNLDTLSRQQLFEEHVAYGNAVGRGPDMIAGCDASPDKRLRVAILSPDLRTHSCAYFLEPLLRHLDRTEFELYLYHDHFSEDEISARLRKFAAVWRNFVGQPDAMVEKVIRSDRPDILVDLTGHIGNMIRLPMFARRVAPVQITYLGYPDTTGVPAMDFRFTDPIADPPGEADAFATEKLVRFAPVAWAYQPRPDAPAVTPPPCASGAPVTFGCFNSPTKFNTTLLQTWACLLETVPNSRLLLKGRDFEVADARDHLMQWMARCGIPLDRVELLPRTAGTVEHLAHYARVDVALDTFPYNGTTTTCEALWMGRPVVTLRGNRHASRVGASLLTALGHSEWIAGTRDAYVEIAARLASNPGVLAAASWRLRADLRGSALLDHRGQAARFGAAVRECWRRKVPNIAAEASRLPAQLQEAAAA